MRGAGVEVTRVPLVGGGGGVVGSILGVVVTVGLAAWNGWVPVVDLRLAASVAVASGLIGAVAGLAPAVRAVRIQPIDALR